MKTSRRQFFKIAGLTGTGIFTHGINSGDCEEEIKLNIRNNSNDKRKQDVSPGSDTALIMRKARDLYFHDLPLPKNYRPGKFTSYGIHKQDKRETILELDGPGCITRIWTTYKRQKPAPENETGLEKSREDDLYFYVYADGNSDPVLSGPARIIAAAAQKLSSPAVPWGGFLDGYSVSLYLPIPFLYHIRIEAEYHCPVDGPYWQIDYKRQIDPGFFTWKQINDLDGLQILPVSPVNNVRKQSPAYQKFTKEVTVSFDPIDIFLDGPAVIRKISINSNYIDHIQLRIAFDGDTELFNPGSRTNHLNFQVDVPLKYFISNFYTAGIERIGNEANIYFPMPFKKKAMLQLLIAREENEFINVRFPLIISIEYENAPSDIDRMYYFNAAASTEISNGYKNFQVVNINGEGHFVGVNLFNTGHDHGGGDNIFFDAGTNTAGQLHGICGEDYFHHAYMRVGVRAPYVDCPTHSARCRHHIEMPVPFKKSFTFNWGCFAGVIPVAVAMWYQKQLEKIKKNEMHFEITGPFPLNLFTKLMPAQELPLTASVASSLDYKKRLEFPRRTWQTSSQNSFVDLCHAFRMYTMTIPPSYGIIDSESCILAQTRIWLAKEIETEFIIGSDDPVRVYLDKALIGENLIFSKYDPFKQFSVKSKLKKGIHIISVVIANTVNTNFAWNGFSLVLKNCLKSDEMHFISL